MQAEPLVKIFVEINTEAVIRVQVVKIVVQPESILATTATSFNDPIKDYMR
jgi:hypothetical protein